MLKVIATNAVISKGYNGASALKFSESGEAVRFRVGKKVYDPKAENNSKWINLSVKAFGPLCERIKKMQLKDGSYINLEGRLDEEVWTDQTSGEQKSQMVVVLEDIEFASSGESKSKDGKNAATAGTTATTAPASSPAYAGTDAANAGNGGFTGYEPFGGGSFFDED